MENSKILAEFKTKKNSLVMTFYQTESDKKYDTYTVRGDNFGGGGDNDSMNDNSFEADLANRLLGTYVYNKIKYLKQTKGKIHKANLYYFTPLDRKTPYFIGDNDIRINHSSIKLTGIITITQENLIKMYEGGEF